MPTRNTTHSPPLAEGQRSTAKFSEDSGAAEGPPGEGASGLAAGACTSGQEWERVQGLGFMVKGLRFGV